MKILLFVLSLGLTACKSENPKPDKKELPQVKTVIHLVVPYGQSNAAGSSPDIENAPNVPQGWAYEWRGYRGEPIHLEEPTRQDKKVAGSAWSAYAIRFHELTGEKVVIANLAVSGRQVSELIPKSDLGEVTFGFVRDVLNYYEKDYEIKSVSMIWLQGEADARKLTPLNEYFSDLKLIKSEFESLHPKAKFYTARIGYNSKHNKKQTDLAFDLGYQQIKRAEYPAYAKAPSFHSLGLMADDGVHYMQEGYNQMGSEIAENVVYYLNGVDVSHQVKQESASMQSYNPFN